MDRTLDMALDHFLEKMRLFWQDRLLSVILHGSFVFGDLAPGYGDLDFLIVVRGEMEETDGRRLQVIRRALVEGDHSAYCGMLEGHFLPRRMFQPRVTGLAFGWGGSGESQ